MDAVDRTTWTTRFEKCVDLSQRNGLYYDINCVRQHNCFYYTSNYVGYMFRLLNSHLQACSLQVKSKDAVHALGSQCVYISEILKPDHLSRKVNVRNV